jgi:hypothetical protein
MKTPAIRIWQSSDNVYESKTSAPGIFSSQVMARCIFCSRSADRLNARDFWNRDDPAAYTPGGRNARGSRRLCVIADFAKVPVFKNASGSGSSKCDFASACVEIESYARRHIATLDGEGQLPPIRRKFLSPPVPQGF